MHEIILDNVRPDFLEAEKINNSEIWGRHFAIKKGERLQIIAPSGSGKTSLIHFLYGLRKDYGGNIFFDKKNIATYSVDDNAAVRADKISIVFQDMRLFAEQTGMQNINVKRLLQPFHTESQIKQMAVTLGIGEKLQQPARNCSYGEQQRIAIIRALQQPFDFLLMDEPFSHLDETNRQKTLQLLEEEAGKRGAAIVLADLKPVDYFKADRTVYLHQA